MFQPGRIWFSSIAASFVLSISALPSAEAQERVLIPYGGHNETVATMWVGIEKGLFNKYGLEARMLQVRSGPLIMATLASGSAQVVWPALSSVLSAVSGGLKVSCVATPINKLPWELVVRKEITSFEELRGKAIGVQSIGGGFWLNTMVALQNLGVDPEKYQLSMRVLGDVPTVTQALIAGNVDAAVLPYSFGGQAKRAGLRSLADTGKLKFPYQGPGLCAQREAVANSPDLITRLVKGMIEAVVFIHDPSNREGVAEVLKKNLRLAKGEDIETSYDVLRAMTTPDLDVAPDLAAWRTVQRIVARLNPKVGQVDVDQVVNGSFVRRLEESGFLPEARKKIGR
ncbi:MAG: ABC transporter substrate-binding protein [Deltaproteobacteria bacterium]|nr:ABC transporter substrate-binding protein [Deltaproteobacteria bacterium]